MVETKVNKGSAISFQVNQQEVEKYTRAPFPSKNDIDRTMDSFNFMPRISLAEADTIKVCGLFLHVTEVSKVRQYKNP